MKSGIPATAIERVERVNQIIAAIASRNRKFFSNKADGWGKAEDPEEVARFIIEGGKLWFHQGYGKNIWMRPNLESTRDFTNGGTLWALTKDFRDFILSGAYTNHKHGYGGLYCPHWGYPEDDMNEIRSVARRVGYLAQTREEDFALMKDAVDGKVVFLKSDQEASA